jgi:flagellar hook assembly protein FlgD
MTEEQPPRSVPAKTFLATRTTAEGAVVEFGLEQAAQVTMVVYDVSGRLVRELVRASFEQGVYQRAWDGRGSSGRAVGAGVYFVQLRTGTKTLVQKLVMAH